MSVLIKGVEPSTRCLGCKFELYGQYCFLLGSYTNDTRAIGRLDNCPVVGLPEKHGDLIDRDELIDDLKYDVTMDQDMLDYEELSEINRITTQADKDLKQNAIDLLKHSRAVIEAEGET